MKQAKRTLVLSAIVLLLSVAMLAGATFAWFTDSVTNSGNKIEAGNLEVDLLQKTSTLSAAQQAEITKASDKPLTTEDGFTVISALTSPVFNYSLWEPGYSTGAVFKVKNSGTLAFKFGFAFALLDDTKNLGNVLIVSVNGEDKGTLAEFATGTPFFSGILGNGMTSAALEIVIRMDTAAGNDYQGATAKFDLVLKAVQTSLEEDGFGNADYDAGASEGWVDAPKADSVVVPVTPDEGTTIVNPDYLAKAEIPADAIAVDATSLTFSIIETESVPEGITVSAGQEAMPFDIKVDGLKADNDTPIAVSLFVGKHLLDVSVYHHAVLLTAETDNFAYDPETGIVSFTTMSFSPFTVVYGMAWDGVSRDSQGLTANTDDATKTVTIDTPAQFAAFATAVNSGTSYEGYTVTLTNDINLAYHEWTPIGTIVSSQTKYLFKGTFDGANHTISNLKITRELSNTYSNSSIGLFGAASSAAKIQNFNLVNVDVKGSLNVAAVLGGSGGAEAKLSNIHVSGLVRVYGYWYVGGLLGKGYSTISNCSVVGDSAHTSYISITGGYAGGIVGFMGEGNCKTISCSVKNMTISGVYNGIGGINGILHYGNTIEDCTVENTVVWETTDPGEDGNRYVGAFAGTYLDNNGKNSPSLINCTFSGWLYSGVAKEDVWEETRYVGSLWYGAKPPATVTITNCTINKAEV